MRRAAPDTPDWAADSLGEFLLVLRDLATAAGLAIVLVVVVALGFALTDLPK